MNTLRELNTTMLLLTVMHLQIIVLCPLKFTMYLQFKILH